MIADVPFYYAVTTIACLFIFPVASETLTQGLGTQVIAIN